MDMHVDWEPGIGDPSFMGWFTVAAYFAVVVLCLRTRKALSARLPETEWGRQPAVWRAMAVFMTALGINKQLDLQTWFTQVGREVLTRNGWMPHHREIQFWIMAGFTGSAALLLVVAAWLVRRRRREYWLLLASVTFTVTFIALRAASLHHFDLLLGSHVMGVKMNWALELTGIGGVALAAFIRLRYARRSSRLAAV